MGKFKPLIAMLATIALALGVLVAVDLLLLGPESPGNAPRNAPGPAGNAPVNNSGLKYEIAQLEDRPEREPEDIWPRQGQRMAGMDFWVLWKTFEFSQCRLICTKDRKLWHDLGSTGGQAHALPVDLAFFDGTVTFALDFEHQGRKYRSRPRTVSFGGGASFAEREVTFSARDKDFSLQLQGRNPVRIKGDNFLTGWFPEDVQVYPIPQPGTDAGGAIRLGVGSSSRVPADGCTGWLEVFDDATGSHDRVLVRLKP